MEIQLVENIAVLGQLGEVVVVPNKVPIAGVVVSQEPKPGLDRCSPDTKTAAELSVHPAHILRSTWPKDDNI